MPVIGGYNTASILPYLDYEKIKKSKKIFCGYSDITAIQMAVISKAKIPTIYGASLIPTFGEYNGVLKFIKDSFLNAIFNKEYELAVPYEWSNQMLDAFSDEWKIKKREFEKNQGWKILNNGKAIGKVLVFNINTLVSLLGNEYIPEIENSIVILEEMNASLDIEERNINALKLNGLFDKIKGLIFSKPETFDSKKSNMKYEDLISEIIGDRTYPIIYNFDCGHTIPSICIPQLSIIEIIATGDTPAIKIKRNAVVSLAEDINEYPN
jgi:muramoyltetrapeptide carboxypeptidase LdcA involved in peptidoglycan recycling